MEASAPCSMRFEAIISVFKVSYDSILVLCTVLSPINLFICIFMATLQYLMLFSRVPAGSGLENC
jgi:hypothetical protein